MGSGSVSIADQIFQFLHKGGDIGKGTIDGGEADISHFIQLAQFVHHHFADFPGGDFFLEAVIGDLLNGGNNLFDLSGGNRALMAGGDNAVADFLGIKKLPGIILFDHQQLLHFHLFIRGKPAAAIDALTAAADGVSIIGGAGIDYAAICAIAKLTFHGCIKPLLS